VRDVETQLGVTASVGISIPGVISPATGLVKNANSIALNRHAFDRDISALLGCEVWVENDANPPKPAVVGPASATAGVDPYG
jgi:fructokinase